MKAVFIELPAFERHRSRYLDDDGFRLLQDTLMAHPEAGAVIEGTGGLRNVRFTLFDKDEMSDLTPKQRVTLRELVKAELQSRRKV